MNMNEKKIIEGKRSRIFNLIIKILIITNISLFLINSGIWILVVQQHLTILADFTSFYTAFRIVKEGDGASLYNLDVQARYQKEILGDLSFDNGLLPYLNPPIVALVFSPLSLFSLNTAYLIWTIGQLGLLIWSIFLLNRTFSHWYKQERITLIITILSFWPLAFTFILGQFTLIILISIIQLYIALKDLKINIAGLWFVSLIVKPHFAIVPSMITFNRRLWRTALVGILGGITINIIPSIFLSIKPFIQYVQLLSYYFGKNGSHADVQYTLREIMFNFFGESKGNLINTVSFTFLILGMILIWWLWMHGEVAYSPRIKLYFAFTIVLSCLLSMHSNAYDDLILVLPAALFYDYLRELNYPRSGFSLLVLVSPVVFFIAAFNKYNLFGLFSPPVVVILLLLGWMIKYLILDYRSERSNRPTTSTPIIPT